MIFTAFHLVPKKVAVLFTLIQHSEFLNVKVTSSWVKPTPSCKYQTQTKPLEGIVCHKPSKPFLLLKCFPQTTGILSFNCASFMKCQVGLYSYICKPNKGRVHALTWDNWYSLIVLSMTWLYPAPSSMFPNVLKQLKDNLPQKTLPVSSFSMDSLLCSIKEGSHLEISYIKSFVLITREQFLDGFIF